MQRVRIRVRVRLRLRVRVRLRVTISTCRVTSSAAQLDGGGFCIGESTSASSPHTTEIWVQGWG